VYGFITNMLKGLSLQIFWTALPLTNTGSSAADLFKQLVYFMQVPIINKGMCISSTSACFGLPVIGRGLFFY